jgi:RNA processing factor Prp31
VIVNEKRLEKIGEYNPNDSVFVKLDINSEEFDFPLDLLHNASIIFAQSQVDEKLKSEDLQVIQMVNAFDDLIQISNLLSERLDCWGIIPTPSEKIKPIKDVCSVVSIEMKKLEKQIDSDMLQIAPNTSKIVGPLIGARLIALSGSIDRFATLPASTIQLLGAEKALFRYKKEGGKPPKHGVIFQHPLINKASRKNRGKIARILATKISIAAKADVFTKKDISDILKNDLDKRIKEIRNQ